jgi:hypothetical protein
MRTWTQRHAQHSLHQTVSACRRRFLRRRACLGNGRPSHAALPLTTLGPTALITRCAAQTAQSRCGHLQLINPIICTLTGTDQTVAFSSVIYRTDGGMVPATVDASSDWFFAIATNWGGFRDRGYTYWNARTASATAALPRSQPGSD